MHYVFTGFARLVFGLTQSPFVLERVLKRHFDNYRNIYTETVETTENDAYVDGMITRGLSREKVTTIKEQAVGLFQKGEFSWISETQI